MSKNDDKDQPKVGAFRSIRMPIIRRRGLGLTAEDVRENRQEHRLVKKWGFLIEDLDAEQKRVMATLLEDLSRDLVEMFGGSAQARILGQVLFPLQRRLGDRVPLRIMWSSACHGGPQVMAGGLAVLSTEEICAKQKEIEWGDTSVRIELLVMWADMICDKLGVPRKLHYRSKMADAMADTLVPDEIPVMRVGVKP